MAQKVDLANRNITDMSNDEQKLVLEELKISRALLEYQQQQPQQLPRIPHIPTFTGDASKGFDYQYWKGLIRSVEVNYTDASIIQAIRKSVSGQPAQIVGTLPIDCTLQTIINALDTAYDLILDAPTAWQRFYNAKQSSKESVVEWHTRLTAIWSQIPGHGMAELHIKKRLWDGLHSDQVRESTRHHYDNDDVTEVEFVKYLRRLVEGRQTGGKATLNAIQPADQQDASELRMQIAVLSSRLDALSTTYPRHQATVNYASARNNNRSNSRIQQQSNNVENTTNNNNPIHSQDYSTPTQDMPQFGKQNYQAATCNNQQYQTHGYEGQSYQQVRSNDPSHSIQRHNNYSNRDPIQPMSWNQRGPNTYGYPNQAGPPYNNRYYSGPRQVNPPHPSRNNSEQQHQGPRYDGRQYYNANYNDKPSSSPHHDGYKGSSYPSNSQQRFGFHVNMQQQSGHRRNRRRPHQDAPRQQSSYQQQGN